MLLNWKSEMVWIISISREYHILGAGCICLCSLWTYVRYFLFLFFGLFNFLGNNLPCHWLFFLTNSRLFIYVCWINWHEKLRVRPVINLNEFSVQVIVSNFFCFHTFRFSCNLWILTSKKVKMNSYCLLFRVFEGKVFNELWSGHNSWSQVWAASTDVRRSNESDVSVSPNPSLIKQLKFNVFFTD